MGSKTECQANLLNKSGESGKLCELVKYIYIQADFSQNGLHAISTVLMTLLVFEIMFKIQMSHFQVFISIFL